MEIKKLGILSVAKIYAITMAIFGLIFGAIVTIISLAVSSVVQGEGFGGYGAASIILLPIFYGVLGFVSGAIGAWIYNIVAKSIGGIQMDLVEVKNTPKAEKTESGKEPEQE